jgi:hypothetical protein
LGGFSLIRFDACDVNLADAGPFGQVALDSIRAPPATASIASAMRAALAQLCGFVRLNPGRATSDVSWNLVELHRPVARIRYRTPVDLS